MKDSELYRVVWREMQRLLAIGAITRRGRPRVDTETEQFHRQTRAFKQALTNLPSDLKADWKRRPNMFDPLLKLQKSMDARDRAKKRAKERTNSGMGPAEPELSLQASSRASAAYERLQAVKKAIASLEACNRKVSSKTVALTMKALYEDKFPVATDTIRKDIAKIRRDRHT